MGRREIPHPTVGKQGRRIKIGVGYASPSIISCSNVTIDATSIIDSPNSREQECINVIGELSRTNEPLSQIHTMSNDP